MAMVAKVGTLTAKHPRTDGLTLKQQRFIDAYLMTLNATEAAIQAGYSKATAHSIGSENLGKPEIKKRIEAALDRRGKTFEWKPADILRDLQEIATNPANRPRDRLKAYELAGKHLGMYRDIVEHSGTVQHIDLSAFSIDELRRLIAIDVTPPQELLEEITAKDKVTESMLIDTTQNTN